MRSFPAAAATVMDVAMPLSPRPTMETTKMRERDDATRRDERGGGATQRDESGRWTTQGERLESDEGAMRWRRTATEVRGEEVKCREVSIRSESELSKF